MFHVLCSVDSKQKKTTMAEIVRNLREWRTAVDIIFGSVLNWLVLILVRRRSWTLHLTAALNFSIVLTKSCLWHLNESAELASIWKVIITHLWSVSFCSNSYLDIVFEVGLIESEELGVISNAVWQSKRFVLVIVWVEIMGCVVRFFFPILVSVCLFESVNPRMLCHL